MKVIVFLTAALVVAISGVLLPLFNSANIRWPVVRLAEMADLVVMNASIYTADPTLPFADSMAVCRGRILTIGNYSSVRELVGYGTKTLNLHGKVVVPGFIDSHVHLIKGGLQMGQIDLHGVDSKEEFVRRIRAGAQSLNGESPLSPKVTWGSWKSSNPALVLLMTSSLWHPGCVLKHVVVGKKNGSWILGGGWSNDLWGGTLPEASWIDEFTHQNPVWLSRMDGHMGLANSLALNMAGITRETKDPDGGSILRTSQGEPNGLLIDSAMSLISTPEISVNERREALVRAGNYALKKGVTTVVDVGSYFPGSSLEQSWKEFTDVYRWADSLGIMVIRVCLFFPIETWSRLADLIQETGRAISQWIYLGGVKAFSDGSLGSRSALVYEEYADDPGNYGLQLTDIENLSNMTSMADKHGLQVAIHAIGDRANDVILDMYESVAAANGYRDRRFRIEHAQHLAPGVASKFGERAIVASVQPSHLLYDADSAIKKLGKERADKGSYLFASILSNGGKLAFGSDWPVVDLDPLGAIKASVERIPLSWESPWLPSERLSLEDAVIAHTIWAAEACFLEKEVGSLSPRKLSDFVVLSSNSWEELKKNASASVVATYVGGAQAYPQQKVI